MIKKEAAFPMYGVTSAVQYGMDLRDYFAAKAMVGLLSGAMADGSSLARDDDKKTAIVAYMVADAMMAERAK